MEGYVCVFVCVRESEALWAKIPPVTSSLISEFSAHTELI